MADIDTALGDVVTLLETTNLDDLTEGALDELGMRLTLALHTIAKATQLRDALEIALIDAMPEATLVMGGTTIRREPKVRSTWKEGGAARMREDVAFGVATKLATDVGTGEVDTVRRNLMQNAINESLKVFNSPQGLKKAGREDIGLRMGEYKNYSDGYNVTVTTIAEEG